MKKKFYDFPSALTPGFLDQHYTTGDWGESENVLVPQKVPVTKTDDFRKACIIRSLISTRSVGDKISYIKDFLAFNERLLDYAIGRKSDEVMHKYCSIVYSNIDELLRTKINGLSLGDKRVYDHDLPMVIQNHIEKFQPMLDRMVDKYKNVKSTVTILPETAPDILQMEPNRTYLLVQSELFTKLIALPTTNIDELLIRWEDHSGEYEFNPHTVLIRTYPNSAANANAIALDSVHDVEKIVKLRNSQLGVLPVVAYCDLEDHMGVVQDAVRSAIRKSFGHEEWISLEMTLIDDTIDHRSLDTTHTFGIMTPLPKIDYPEVENKTKVVDIKGAFDNIEDDEYDDDVPPRMFYRTPVETPYASVTKYICDVLDDPTIKKVYMTLYRVSEHGVILEHLKNAAIRGVKIRLYIELNANGNEQSNIEIYRSLECLPNVELYFGLTGMKVHAKIFAASDGLDIRGDEGDQFFSRGNKCYIHFGTGNYNESTGEQYIDTQYFSTIYSEYQKIKKFFNAIASKEIVCTAHGFIYRSDVLPYKGKSNVNAVKHTIMRMLDDVRCILSDQGRSVDLVIKCNHMQDADINAAITSLARTHYRQCKIYLIVRSTCSLEQSHLSKEAKSCITFIHPVGDLLEHDRIYGYRSYKIRISDQTREEQQVLQRYKVYISSADLMYRNLYNRAELIKGFESGSCGLAQELFTRCLKPYIELVSTKAKHAPRLSISGTFKSKHKFMLDVKKAVPIDKPNTLALQEKIMPEIPKE